jgi:tetratricopeptide (TPR) repeat protein
MKPKKIPSWRPFNFALGLFLLSLSSFLPSAWAAREIGVIAAASSDFKKNPEWQKEIRDRLLFANEIFEDQFKIHFSIKSYKNWEPEDEKRETNLLIEELRSQFTPGIDEIVIGFHKMSQPFGQDVMDDFDTVGTAQFFRGFVVLRDPFQDLGILQRQVIMAHELAHLFGAIHVADPKQIMNRSLPQEPVLVLDPDNQEIILAAAQVDFQRGVESILPGDIDKLIQIYERLIRKNPHSDFYYQLGHFYEVRGLHSRAIAVWEEAARYEYANPMIHWELGRYYYENSRFDLAIRELGTAVAFFILPSQKRQRAQAFNFLGVAYYRRGNLEQAIFNWLKGLSSDPDNLELQGNLAAAYMENGDVDRGISELLKLSVKYPDDVTTLSNLSVAYLKKNDFEKSAYYARQALDKFALAEQVKKQNKEAEAQPAKEGETAVPAEIKGRLISDIPESVLLSNMGAAYLGLKQWDPALVELEKARKQDPENPETLQNLAYAYTQKKDYEKALEVIQRALELNKDNAQLHYFLAEAYAMTGKRAEAIQAARQALVYAKQPLKSNLHKNIAVMYAQENKPAEAIAELKTSLSLNWNDADTHLKLGYLYGQTGNMEEARRSFQNALRVNPQLTEAKKALESVPTP